MEGLKIAKLVSGEFIVGRVYQQYLINIFLVSFNIDQKTGIFSTKLIPYMAPFDNTLNIMMPFDKIMGLVDAPQELITQYITVAANIIATQKESEQNNENTGNNRTESSSDGSNGISGNSDSTETKDS